MRQVLFFSIFAYLIACNNANNTTEYNLNAAKDAYDYPNLKNKTDTDIYVYQLKGILDRSDSLLYVNYGSTYLRQFDEENLSLKACSLETFRFSYCPFGQQPINITFDKNQIIVKTGVSGVLYPIDTSAKFKYKTRTISLSNNQYNLLLDALKAQTSTIYPGSSIIPEKLWMAVVILLKQTRKQSSNTLFAMVYRSTLYR